MQATSHHRRQRSCPAAHCAGISVTFSTGQSGSDVGIKKDTSLIFTFGVVSGATVTDIQTNFTMKIDGNSPNANIRLSLYETARRGWQPDRVIAVQVRRGLHYEIHIGLQFRDLIHLARRPR